MKEQPKTTKIYFDQLSDCCQAGYYSICADEGTCHAECAKCGKPCSFASSRTSEEQIQADGINNSMSELEKAQLNSSPLPPNKENLREEELAQKLHEWYLEACQNPESGTDFNPEAQVLYKNLRESQKFLDRYIASKVLSLLSEREEAVKNEIIKELYFSATLYSDGSPTLMHSYLERKYPEVLEAIIRGENK